MAHHTSTFGRSASMPILAQQQQDEEESPQITSETASDEHYRALQDSPGFQSYRNQFAGIWSPTGAGFPNPLMSKNGARMEAAGSKDDSSAYKTGLMTKGSSPTLTTPLWPDSMVVTGSGRNHSLASKASSTSFDRKSNNDKAVFGPGTHRGIPIVIAGLLPTTSTIPEPKSPFSRFHSMGSSYTDHGRASGTGSEESSGCKTPNEARLPGLQHRSESADTLSPLKDLDVPSGFLHHRRASSRLSSLPTIQSPLGPRHYVDDLGSDNSGLVSPMPTSPSQAPRYELSVKKTCPLGPNFDGLTITTDSQGSLSPTSESSTTISGSVSALPPSPGHRRCLEKNVLRTPQKPNLHALKVSTNRFGSPFSSPDGPTTTSSSVSPLPYSPGKSPYLGRSPQFLDLHALKVGTSRNGSTYHASVKNGFGHDSTITDPFVDKSPAPSPFLKHVKQKYVARRVQVPNTPVFKFPTQNESVNPFTPTFQDFNSCVPATPTYLSNTPGIPNFAGTPSRVDLPIPPLPLSSTYGHLTHTRETRARLDAQAAVRSAWIKTEAKKIADLSRLSTAAARQYSETQSQADYEHWQHFAAAYDEATDLDRRQEERRNLFMQTDVSAMRTGPENVVGDATRAGGQGEGALLGFQMAYMERVCMEVKRREAEKGQDVDEEKIEEEDEVYFSKEMLDTLSKTEKKELRSCLVARLMGVAEKRMGE